MTEEDRQLIDVHHMLLDQAKEVSFRLAFADRRTSIAYNDIISMLESARKKLVRLSTAKKAEEDNKKGG